MRKLRMGMVGGGIGSFIGDVHRKAASIDGMIDLVCGAFSSNPEKSNQSGKALFLPPDRCYGSYEEMIIAEKKLPEGQRMDFVSVVTPNHVHFAPTKFALENGFHVICDKPVTFDLAQSLELKKIIQRSGLLFALTHNYTGYPLVKQAKMMIEKGEIGKIRKVLVQYHQGWLSEKIEDAGQKQASWRTDPNLSGIGGALGDIGTHAENLMSYITGLDIEEIAADVNIFVEGRLLDDDANILLRLSNGAKGVMSISQIAAGEENNLSIKIYGEKGSLEWHQEEPNTLLVRRLDRVKECLRPGVAGLYSEVNEVCRVPAGHPEGYLEGFATIYKHFAKHMLAVLANDTSYTADYPTIEEGVKGMQFIYAAVESSKKNAQWVKMNE